MKHYYIKIHLAFLIVLFFSVSVSSQNSEALWTKTTKEGVSKSRLVIRKTEPTKATYYQLDLNGLKSILQNAPERKGFTGVSNVIVSFPNADGSLEAYRVLEASVMHPTLQAKHPNLRSYVGQSIENPSTIIRFSVTTQGLHTMTLSSNKGVQFIDPYTKDDNSYIIYSKRDLPRLKDGFICGVIDQISANEDSRLDFGVERNANDGKLREFDLAIACTIEYADFHVQAAGVGGGTEDAKKDAVLVAMMATMTRVNGIYERDLSITMLIIANNKDIIFINTDPFTPPANDDASLLIGQSQTEINAAIGAANYDIGHTFSTGAGGLASLGVPCVDSQKARGVTGLTMPVGDAFDIDFVAHEMGHQFGANHTFNGDAGNCSGGNRNAPTAYEPGSGSTIMAYAGICSPQNVQSNSDAYFHQASIAEMWTYITAGSGTCADPQTATGNGAPTAIAGNDYIIPISTPYKLTGSSTDNETTSTHTFTWEQYDLGSAGIPTETTATGPLVRSFKGTTDPIRYVPRLADVLSNGGVSTTWEKLVSISRAINFELTVRDNGMDGGQTDSDGMIVTTDAAAGPFLLTSQNTDQLVYASSANISVIWDVADTDIGTVDTDNVNILLSIDGGLTYPFTLASGTPNDGSQMVNLPIVEMPYCRIMVEGAGNIFYAINTKDFAVGNYTYQAMDVCDDYLFNFGIPIDVITIPSIAGYVMTVDDSVTISDVNINVDMTHNNIGELDYGFGVPFEGGDTVNLLAFSVCDGSVDVDLTYDDEGGAFSCASTANGDFVVPIDPLSVADGTDSMGDWIIWMRDTDDNGVSGILNSVTLTICHSELVPTLSVDDFNLEDSFSVFPNPNHGEFTVKLYSNSGNSIKISVYDIRGRRVFDNIYDSSSNFNEVINLGNVQSGIYLLNISDGFRSTTKKIIVN